MPSNDAFIPKIIERFIAIFNARRTNETERQLDIVTRKLKGTINVVDKDQPIRVMELPPAEANFIEMLTRLLSRQPHDGPMMALDIGTFTGRSALAIAQALPEGGKVISCGISTNAEEAEHIEIAMQHWKAAKVEDKVDLRVAPASETLQKLLDEGNAGKFDMIFIDADKKGYDNYYEKALELLRPGGLVILDNMLWSGRVADPKYYTPESPNYDSNAAAIRELNDKISKDDRVQPMLLGFEDGVVVAEKVAQRHTTKLMRSNRRRHEEGVQAAV